MLAYRIYFNEIKNLFRSPKMSDKKVIQWCKDKGVFCANDEVTKKWFADFLAFEIAYDSPLIEHLKSVHKNNWEEHYKPRKANLEAHISVVQENYSNIAVVNKTVFDLTKFYAIWHGTHEQFKSFCEDIEADFTMVKSTTTKEDTVLTVLSEIFVLKDRQPLNYVLQTKYHKGKICLHTSTIDFGTLFKELSIQKVIRITDVKKFSVVLASIIQNPENPSKSAAQKTIENGLSRKFDYLTSSKEQNIYYPLFLKYSTIIPSNPE